MDIHWLKTISEKDLRRVGLVQLVSDRTGSIKGTSDGASIPQWPRHLGFKERVKRLYLQRLAALVLDRKIAKQLHKKLFLLEADKNRFRPIYSITYPASLI